MSNQYFQWTHQQKRRFRVKLILFSLLALLLLGVPVVLLSPQFALLLVVVFAMILSVVAPFFDVPALVDKGKLTYHSLFLLAEPEKDQLIKIHGGTLFDYYFTFPQGMPGAERTKMVLLEFLKGLQHMAQTMEEELEIQGTSYIINERTASKVGLQAVKLDFVQLFILAFNYLNLMVSMSLVKKSIHFPNLNEVRTYQGSIAEIKARLPYINSMIEKLERNSPNSDQPAT